MQAAFFKNFKYAELWLYTILNINFLFDLMAIVDE